MNFRISNDIRTFSAEKTGNVHLSLGLSAGARKREGRVIGVIGGGAQTAKQHPTHPTDASSRPGCSVCPSARTNFPAFMLLVRFADTIPGFVCITLQNWK